MTTVVTSNQSPYAPPPLRGGGSRSRQGPEAGGAVSPAVAPDGVITERFLQFLIPAAATVASTFGPQIGGAIGGLFGEKKAGAQVGGQLGGLLGSLGGGFNLGGLFGGRALPDGLPGEAQYPPAVPEFDFTAPLVQQCAMGCFGQITPELVDVFKQMYPEMKKLGDSSRSEVEIAAVERFWPEIAGFLTGKVAEYLPGLMQTATNAVMPLIGGREAGVYRPILTGTEAHSRWFLPVLTTVLTTVQQHLPELLSLVSGDQRASRSMNITWNDVAVNGRLREDFVRVVRQDPIGDANAVELTLQLANHLSWAKQIEVLDDNGAVVGRLHVQDARKVATQRFDANQVLANGQLVFGKAKMFGIMTPVYALATNGVEELRGQNTTCVWMAD